MNELTLEHIAPYLPYGLKIARNESLIPSRYEEWAYVFTLNPEVSSYNDRNIFSELLNGKDIVNTPIKPLLRPLSELTDEVIEELYFMFEGESDASCWESNVRQMRKYGGTRYSLPLEIWNWMYENMFDINNLIGKGLAIDINTVK
tara:strand:- start:3755 stop:4192 length:438 start_codon:yes stop_codon:yes gene_type:complete